MRRVAIALVTIGALGAAVAQALPASAGVHPFVVTKNLILNGNAEAAPGSANGSTVPVPKWTLSTGTTTFTAVQYAAGGGFPDPASPGPRNRGANFFAGGPGEELDVAVQSRSLNPYAESIDAETATFVLSGYLGGFSSQGDNAVVRVQWLNGHGTLLSTATIGPVTAADRNSVTGLLYRTVSGSVPAKARKAVTILTLTRLEGSYNDGYADNLSLKLTTP